MRSWGSRCEWAESLADLCAGGRRAGSVELGLAFAVVVRISSAVRARGSSVGEQYVLVSCGTAIARRMVLLLCGQAFYADILVCGPRRGACCVRFLLILWVRSIASDRCAERVGAVHHAARTCGVFLV